MRTRRRTVVMPSLHSLMQAHRERETHTHVSQAPPYPHTCCWISCWILPSSSSFLIRTSALFSRFSASSSSSTCVLRSSSHVRRHPPPRPDRHQACPGRFLLPPLPHPKTTHTRSTVLRLESRTHRPPAAPPRRPCSAWRRSPPAVSIDLGDTWPTSVKCGCMNA